MAKMGCAKCGGTMKKMAKGGPINKPMTYAKAQTGSNKLSSEFNIIGGMPQYTSGTDGKFGKMKKGGTVKKKMAKGGSTSFGMLSVKAGIDNNPKPTAADRIAGAKMNKKKMGGVTKAKKK